MNTRQLLRDTWLKIFIRNLLIVASLNSVALALTPQQIYALVSPSVWRVQTYDEDGLVLAIGTAIVITSDTLVTNCHVLGKARRVVVRQDSRTIDAKLELWDPERDVCQLKVINLGSPSVTLGEVSGLQIGQNVFALGNPRGLDLTMSAGLLSSIRRNEKGQVILLQTSAPISGGSSGGGLFDEHGVLIGLTTLGSVGDAQNLNFAVPVDWIKELQQRQAKLNKSVELVATASKPNPTLLLVPNSNPPKNTDPRGCVGAGNLPVPSLATDEIADTSRLPNSTERMREAYGVFLTCPLPRAFAISESGRWWYAWSTNPSDKSAPRNPTARAIYKCEKNSGSRCFLYAVDNRIVYQPESPPSD